MSHFVDRLRILTKGNLARISYRIVHLAETIDQVLEYSLCPAPPVDLEEDAVSEAVDALTSVEVTLN